ncbi:MAG: radical SAM protein [Bacteroidota bacterium]
MDNEVHPGWARRMLQVHPSLLCNFVCSHCYSSSSPKSQSFLSLSYLSTTLEQACALGYDKLSVSGGEPMLYPFLKEILCLAKALGMTTSFVTNGSFPRTKYESLFSLVDTVGVSVDGGAELHNTIRGNKNSFRKIDAFLDFAKDLFSNVGISFTLSDQSWEDLPELIDYATSKKVDVFQIHPLEINGRAVNKNLTLSDDTLMRAFALYRLLACQSTCDIHFNCFSKHDLYAMFADQLIDAETMASAIDLIVLNETGELLPYTYGMDPKWKIADKDHPLSEDTWRSYKSNLLAPLKELNDQTYRGCLANRGSIVQYYDKLRDLSRTAVFEKAAVDSF